jgi:hypothetical protein
MAMVLDVAHCADAEEVVILSAAKDLSSSVKREGDS